MFASKVWVMQFCNTLECDGAQETSPDVLLPCLRRSFLIDGRCCSSESSSITSGSRIAPSVVLCYYGIMIVFDGVLLMKESAMRQPKAFVVQKKQGFSWKSPGSHYSGHFEAVVILRL